MQASELISHIRFLKSKFLGKIFDLKHGVRTNKVINEEELGFKSSELYPYVPVDAGSLKKILKKLNIRKTEVFYDVGCGKGRSLIIAREFPFTKIYGIDISEELLGFAGKNLRDEPRVQLKQGDASALPFPNDVDFLFLGCPFTGTHFDHFLLELEKSLISVPRRFRFLYQTPIEEEKVLASGYFKKLPVPISKYSESYSLFEFILPTKNCAQEN